MKTYNNGLGLPVACRSLMLLLCVVVAVPVLQAQEQQLDSLPAFPVHLDEVVLIGNAKKLKHQTGQKPLATLDEYLEGAQKVTMIKRGAYAWEPALNNMTSERLVVTIDGMQIFGACTDKMDPVTSYVDVSNLAEAQIQSSQQGAQFGNTIGGGINLSLQKNTFENKGLSATIENAFETNNNLRVVGADVGFESKRFYANGDILYRKADNYYAGGGEEVEFSQYEKYNASLQTGYKLAEGKKLLASLIYDEAKDVGYPALPMDVSLARAVIASVSLEQDSLLSMFGDWETKLYYNTIKHVMDDTQRPNVPIHMDMPGWSETAGMYSQAKYAASKHVFTLKVDGYYNRSYAEMTMYPNNPNEPNMFMLTWPDVRTWNTGLYLEDVVSFKNDQSLLFSTRLGVHRNHIADDFGFNSLTIFYPELERSQTRLLKSISGEYKKSFNVFEVAFGAAYGERAPSVSEGYGFYLFNSYDGFDYLGDPNLSTEASMETHAAISYKEKQVELKLEANYFHLPNYIIGKVVPEFAPMTIGANGVKVYTNLDYAQIFNTSLQAQWRPFNRLVLKARVSWHRGTDNKGENLPLISPLAYKTSVAYSRNGYSGTVSVNGNATQEHFNPAYGEKQTDAYNVVSATFGKRFFVAGNSLYAKAGIENIFDTNYTTFNDWNNIPQMGRNMFVTLSYSIN
ncbi:TonB-dependent receptor [Marixanthomonas spongiae]|uniref:TonB-dependent receptor n=1 Tax=Marixanthomonas spongiae TaxID=2174845 RepID=A0A2U0I547_9FLAO|nr:TonB-dependent receptor [Marixanthomonas spongiae]PVW16222.1 TonB-dependent receptor [Marixanthomonas spongiae]